MKIPCQKWNKNIENLQNLQNKNSFTSFFFFGKKYFCKISKNNIAKKNFNSENLSQNQKNLRFGMYLVPTYSLLDGLFSLHIHTNKIMKILFPQQTLQPKKGHIS
jgi:hypothetical protein